MLFNLQDKVAVVTGGGSGIGQAIARCFAGQHATVVILDLNDTGGTATIKEIETLGGKALFLHCEVNDENSVNAATQKIISQYGQIDILINSAGIAHIGNAENTEGKDFEKLFQVNVKGVYHMLHAILPQMKKQQKGVILNVASVASTVGISDRFAYSMTKGAVVSMTLSVAKDFIKDGIRCNCISPGRVHTPFVDGFLKANYPGNEKEMFDKLSKTQPIGRMARPEEIAWLSLYLCSDEAGFVTGCDYPIDGGFTRLNN